MFAVCLSARFWIRFAALLLMCTPLFRCTLNPTAMGWETNSETNRAFFSTDISAYIAQKARCELRDAFVGLAADLIEQKSVDRKIADNLRENPALIANLDPWNIDPVTQVRASMIQGSTFLLNFDLKMTENNTHTAMVGLTPGEGPHVLKIGISNHIAKLDRDNQRKFEFPTQKIGDLQNIDCPDDPQTRFENFAYPTSGAIGMRKTARFFASFLQIDTSSDRRELWAQDALGAAYYDLVGPRKATISELDKKVAISNMQARAMQLRQYNIADKRQRACYTAILQRAGQYFAKYFYERGRKGSKPLAALSETLQFTTKLDGGINPSIEFAAGALSLKSLGWQASNSRTDLHKVTFTGTPSPKPDFKESTSVVVPIAKASSEDVEARLTAEVKVKLDGKTPPASDCAAPVSAGGNAGIMSLDRTKRAGAPGFDAAKRPPVGEAGLFVSPAPDPAADALADEMIRRSRDEEKLRDALRSLTE